MTTRASAIGGSLLLAAASAAALGSLTVQLAFAVVAIGVIGMAHGASDLAIVERRQRPLFLALYVLVGILCLSWWIANPAVALPAFLVASAVHFGLEDAPEGSILEKIARGTSLVATPAALHMGALTELLSLAGTSTFVPPMVAVMAFAGGGAAAWLIAGAIQRRDGRFLTGTAALLVLPPLVGFSVGFLMLHALPQTVERSDQLGCADIADYLRATGPILFSAVILIGITGGLLLRLDPSGVRPLFAGIAALAVPHLLVTPWFEPQERPFGAMRGRRRMMIGISNG